VRLGTQVLNYQKLHQCRPWHHKENPMFTGLVDVMRQEILVLCRLNLSPPGAPKRHNHSWPTRCSAPEARKPITLCDTFLSRLPPVLGRLNTCSATAEKSEGRASNQPQRGPRRDSASNPPWPAPAEIPPHETPGPFRLNDFQKRRLRLVELRRGAGVSSRRVPGSTSPPRRTTRCSGLASLAAEL